MTDAESASVPLTPQLKPAHLGEYGYIRDGYATGCTKEELLERCSNLELPAAVWTPEFDSIILPTASPLIQERIASAPQRLRWSRPAGAVGLVGLLAGGLGVVREDAVWLVVGGVLIIGGAGLQVARIVAIRRLLRRVRPEIVAKETQLAVFTGWLMSRPVVFTRGLQAAIVLVAALQVWIGLEQSVDLAALVKSQVRAGEWWRLSTATLLHGSFLHFWINIGALSHFSRSVEVLSKPFYAPFVFVAAGIGGSIASVLLWPTTSVGASGGIFGLVGFLIVQSYRSGTRIPAFYRRVLWGVVIVTGAVGGVLFFVIDNAAHAGGLATGAVLGAMLPAAARRTSMSQKVVGIAAWATIVAVAGITIARLLQAV